MVKLEARITLALQDMHGPCKYVRMLATDSGLYMQDKPRLSLGTVEAIIVLSCAPEADRSYSTSITHGTSNGTGPNMVPVVSPFF